MHKHSHCVMQEGITLSWGQLTITQLLCGGNVGKTEAAVVVVREASREVAERVYTARISCRETMIKERFCSRRLIDICVVELREQGGTPQGRNKTCKSDCGHVLYEPQSIRMLTATAMIRRMHDIGVAVRAPITAHSVIRRGMSENGPGCGSLSSNAGGVVSGWPSI